MLEMCMFGFLKRILKKEEPVRSEEVELPALHSWFEGKTKSREASLKQDMEGMGQKIASERDAAQKNLALLGKAGLQNPNIPERAKHFMQGNRDAFSKKVHFFLDSIHVPQEISSFPAFYSGVQDELKELMQGTAKSFQILQEFFANESRQVMANVGVIEKELNSFKSAFDAADLDILEDTKQRISDFQAKLNLRKALEKDLSQKKKELQESTSEIRRLKKDVEMLQKDSQLNSLKNRLKDVQARIDDLRARITGPFSAINHPLKKFERITYKHRTIIQKYIDSPLEALLQDLHLSVLKALHDMELAVLNNRIDLKEKKKEKTLEVLKLLTKEYLGSFLTEYGQINHEKDKIKKTLAGLDIVALIEQKKERIAELESKRVDIEQRIQALGRELEKIDIPAVEQKLVSNLRKITETDIRILY